MIPTYFMVLTTVFLLLNVAPGDTVDLLFAEFSPHEADKEQLRRELNLDKPLYVQYALWLGKTVTGDLGKSLQRGTTVWALIRERVPNSLRLGIMALSVAWLIAIPVGVLAAVKADTAADYIARSAAILMLSIPGFWVAVLVIVIPAYTVGISMTPSYVPFSVDPITNLRFFVVPAIVLGVFLTGTTLRMTRSMMLEVMRSDYIRTARAKGLTERTVIYRHALKNALIPVVTILGAQTALLIGGTVIIEQIFGVPGVGSLMYQSVLSKDFPVVQAVVVMLSAFVLMMNLIVDLTYAWLDPRIKYS